MGTHLLQLPVLLLRAPLGSLGFLGCRIQLCVLAGQRHHIVLQGIQVSHRLIIGSKPYNP